ncbi:MULTISPECIES: ArsR/SmtB family transcription factor [Dactylosporangium]|uniref:Transcriptional regulator n=2 Tax=Dactylosporangium TaxID=35753 RepID=A0A9W6NMN2_9ACTN|nr:MULTISPECIES: helix-turn-helix domain-containing protein [Dactylosporangium]UAB94915.1 winged helix-turn-helix transcriptional regulator [Dactylosporangium vinaceum]UWZ43285.1 winged helix-turn-helix transcriptional regulator [Dactylosporangium matsuzakiense]GLL02609.1 transcriptional regulator [Dactylosporangium matsuzakiense]
MVSIGLSASAVARIRFAVSPLWETIASLRVLRDPGAHAIHLPWAAGLRHVTPPIDVPPFPAAIPDFLTPKPPGPFPELDEELALLPAPVAAGLREYFAVALAPHWPRIRALLEADVHARSRTLAADGVGGLLNDLHANVSFADGTLSVLHRWCTAPDVADGGDLVLIPSVFVWPTVLTVFDVEAQLAYPARGIGTLWESTPAPDVDALGALVGRARARLLTELAAPASTTDLADRTGLTPGGVSQHLAVLRAAGLVRAHRAGRSVLNVRTAAAEVLLNANGRRPPR